MINDHIETVDQAASYLEGVLGEGFRPQTGLTLGTGLSGLADKIEPIARVAYADIPGFPVSTVQSHAGELIFGHLGGSPVAGLAGRFHIYEGYSPRQVTLPVRVLAQMGVERFIFCNAAGGLDPAMEPGRVMLIADHINFTGLNPLTGPNVDEWGVRFPEMTEVYDPGLRGLARSVAAARGVDIYEGVYIGLPGPCMETPAETAMLRGFGADAVGMSTVLEVIAAKHHGLKVLGFSAISNVNRPEDMEEAPIELVIKNAEKAGAGLSTIIEGVLEDLK